MAKTYMIKMKDGSPSLDPSLLRKISEGKGAKIKLGEGVSIEDVKAGISLENPHNTVKSRRLDLNRFKVWLEVDTQVLPHLEKLAQL